MGDTYRLVESSRSVFRTMSSMSTAQNYGFHKKPRFSVNHLSTYMMARTAPQRKRVIREAKFPKNQPRAAYSDARGSIRDFLRRSTRDLSQFDFEIGRLEARLPREPEGWSRDEIKRTIEALKAFQETYVTCKLKGLPFHGFR